MDIENVLDLTGYVRYGDDDGLGGTAPEWMTARGRALVLATGHPEPHVQDVLARLAAGNITRDQARTELAA